MHGFRLVWGGDRRYTWLLSSMAAGGLLHRLLPDNGWLWLFGALPFLVLYRRDWDRYGLKRKKPT